MSVAQDGLSKDELAQDMLQPGNQNSGLRKGLRAPFYVRYSLFYLLCSVYSSGAC